MKTTSNLLKELSLDEKIAQLCAINSSDLLKDRGICPQKCAELLKDGAGAFVGAGGAGGIIVGAGSAGGDFSADEVMQIHRDLQEQLLKHAKHPIAAIIVEECLSGYQQRDATVYPQSIAFASTWEPALVEQMTKQIGALMRGAGVQQALSPVLDLVCDPRWGRNEETYGEDPVLAATMACAFVKGLQDDDLTQGVAATLKHFVAYGLTEAGRNLASLRGGERLVRDTHLLPFEAALKAGAASIMSAYSDLDGEVITTSNYWLTEVLRDELKFDGTVVCDFGAIDMLTMIFRTARSPEEAVTQAFQAGVDMDFPSGHNYRSHLKQLIENGTISEAVLNERVERVLLLKEQLGLLSGDSKHYLPNAKPDDFDSDAQRKLARQAATEAVTLLKNDGTLPLQGEALRIAVLGPNADAPDSLLGDYSYTGGRRGFWWKRMTRPDPINEVKATSILEAIREQCAGVHEVRYHPGCSLLGEPNDATNIQTAAARAADADVAVIVVGESSTSTSGECRDRDSIDLTGNQAELIRRVSETGTPVVAVLIHGRPLDLSAIEPHCAAILSAWFPGDEGGHAIAEVLTGKAEPGGRLPVSFPKSLGLCPANSRMTLNSGWEKLVGDIRPTPLYPFGHGLSYSEFHYSGLDSIVVDSETNALCFSVTVQNTGSLAASDVVQVYIGDLAASLVQPEFCLKTFKKIHLDAGKSATLHGSIPFAALSFHDRKMQRITEAGRFEIRIGRSCADIQLRNFFELVADYRPESYFEAEASLKVEGKNA